MNASQLQNSLVLCAIVGFGAMEFMSRRYQRSVRTVAAANDTKLELFMFLSLLAVSQQLAMLATAHLGA